MTLDISEALAEPFAVTRRVKAQPNPSKVLIVDIERLPGLAPIFDQRTRGFIPAGTWHRLPSLLCWAAKWYGKRDMEFRSVWGDGMDVMRERSWELFDEADVVVGYNSISFDVPHLRSEWLLGELAPPRPWRNVDLFRVNKRLFGFESKSLNHLCQRLGLATKSGHYDANLAEQCVDGDELAQRKMERYNKGDVRITEQALDALRPWMSDHPHLGVSAGVPACNACASRNLLPDGEYRAVLFAYPQWRCQDCGALTRGRDGVRIADHRGVKDV